MGTRGAGGVRSGRSQGLEAETVMALRWPRRLVVPRGSPLRSEPEMRPGLEQTPDLTSPRCSAGPLRNKVPTSPAPGYCPPRAP